VFGGACKCGNTGGTQATQEREDAYIVGERESYENIIQNNNLIKIYNDLESEVYIYIYMIF
jgi:hypothetical protein